MSIAVAGDANAAPGVVEYSAALGGNPAQDAVLLADRTILDVIKRPLLGIGRGCVGSRRALTVFGMQAVVEVLHRNRRLRRDAEHRLGARRPDQAVVDHVDVPEADIGIVDSEPQPLFACGKRRARPLPLDHKRRGTGDDR